MAGTSSVILGLSWTDLSVLGSQLFGQAGELWLHDSHWRVNYRIYTTECKNHFLRPNMITGYYSILRNQQIPNTKYYLWLRIPKYRIQIAIFGPIIQIPKSYYQIIVKQLNFIKGKPIYLSCTRRFVLEFHVIIWTGIRANFPISK